MNSIRSILFFLFLSITSVAAGTTAEGLAFLEKKKAEEGVVTLPSGLL
jgi:hypothetical protein